MVHWDGAGNLPPQRALARELVRRGHDVHALSHDSVADVMCADGVAFHGLATARQHSSSDRLSPREEMAFLGREIVASPAYAADFQGAVDQLRPDLCLVDASLLSVLGVVVNLPIPCGALFHSIYDPVRRQALLNRVIPQTSGTLAQLTYARLVESLALTLVFSYPAFSPSAAVEPRVSYVGPLREPIGASDWPRRFPDRRFVLVSLSTSFQDQHATLQRICEALGSLPLEALVTTGPSILTEELSVGGGVEVRSYAPHDQVLPSADLLITHAGHGTAMAGAGAGVPMLCMPMGRDQPFVASRVEALRLGRTLSPDAPTDEIGATVAAMLSDAKLKAACRSFAAGVDRFGDLARAADLVEQTL